MKMLMVFFLMDSFPLVIVKNIPVSVWNINGYSLPLKPVPVFSQNGEFYDEILNSVSQKDLHLLIFTIDKLSSEDFSVRHTHKNNVSKYLENFLDDRMYVFISSIPSPLLYVDKVKCGKQRIEVDEINQQILEEIASSLAKSCIVIVHFSKDFQFFNQEIFTNVLMMSSENFTFDVIGAFTANKPSWNYESSPITLRRLLQSADVVAKDIINIKDCILFHASAVNLIVEPLYNESFSLSSPNTNSSECTPTKTKFLFKNRGFYWQTYLGLYMAVKQVNYKLPITFCNVTIGAPYGKSYFSEGARIKSILSKFQVSVYFTKLQVQPFAVKDKVFSKAFLETPSWNFMTIAIWEGVFIAIISIVIIKWGISHLLNVSSMERFDDAKDKTASVSIVTPK
ncbi:V-type proton ATPase subunit S1 isoform X4 [Parasteatoda tepidariorum]|uniref:V-type proton ATPase subunit S1 isoform X4 n=1 Tax=Parasteatoda tepidariorum TaxID=114398 RepID=UPI001C71BD99|nr:uncharacterized protein LOC107442870 isoform X2 [Parasteatoda tepidariorum]